MQCGTKPAPSNDNLEERHDAYAYGKLKQDELVQDYHRRFGVPFTIVRPGIVIGPGKKAIPGFVGMDTFGFFMHMGGGGRLPLTYVDNCAEAIVLAGLVKGVEGEVFNVVDDATAHQQGVSAGVQAAGAAGSGRCPFPTLRPTPCARCGSGMPTGPKGQLPPVFNRRDVRVRLEGTSLLESEAERASGLAVSRADAGGVAALLRVSEEWLNHGRPGWRSSAAA